MITVTFARDGRTWYGRKLYKVTLENVEVGALNVGRTSAEDATAMMRRILENEIAAGREFKIVNLTDLQGNEVS
jgi:hypothetical protein